MGVYLVCECECTWHGSVVGVSVLSVCVLGV